MIAWSRSRQELEYLAKTASLSAGALLYAIGKAGVGASTGAAVAHVLQHTQLGRNMAMRTGAKAILDGLKGVTRKHTHSKIDHILPFVGGSDYGRARDLGHSIGEKSRKFNIDVFDELKKAHDAGDYSFSGTSPVIKDDIIRLFERTLGSTAQRPERIRSGMTALLRGLVS